MFNAPIKNKLALGVPVLGRKDLTLAFANQLGESVSDPFSFILVIIDNASPEPYEIEEFEHLPFDVGLIRNPDNAGFYFPIIELAEAVPDAEIYALAHNDLLIYEKGWDQRLKESFRDDARLGMVGFCGSWEIDSFGGRGRGTMCFFRGERGQSQAAGQRIVNLQPSLILDSLFIAMRPTVIGALGVDEDITPAHFYDKIWPLRAIEAGWRVATLGVEVDHLGGETIVAEPAYHDDMRRWCEEHGLAAGDDPGGAVYAEAERRFLTEYRQSKGKVPAWVDAEYNTYWGTSP